MSEGSRDALKFAEALKHKIETEWAGLIQAEAVKEAEHKVLHIYVPHLMEAMGYSPARFDWEGSGRKGRNEHSYALLGTSTHPDAATLSPFRCAIEFDREPVKRNWVHFKMSMMKASCHVLSGAYDACLFVFCLQRKDSTSATYLAAQSDDPSKGRFTDELLRSLQARGLVIAFVPPPP